MRPGGSTTLGAVNGKVDEAIAALGALLGDRLSTSDSVRDLHGRDESAFPPARPDAVAFPRSTEEVAAIVATCAEHGVPIVAFGTGSSVEGQILAVEGGVALVTSLMDAILRVSIEDLDATVQPGVTRRALEKRIGGDGAFFSVDPGADASLGGMAATGASGTNTVRYGTMRENVLALEVVLADGRIIRTGTRARKSSAGYDLTHLFIGSEGTLGIITELTLRLRPIPEAISAAVCSFPTTHDAVGTAIAIVQSGVPIARCELLDATIADVADLPFPAPLLGHVADGNFHVMLLIDPDDPKDRSAAEAVYERIVDRAIAVGGTCTGEHGIGLGKRRALGAQSGEGVEVMRALKHALDPADRLNPGKVLPRLS